MEKDELEVSLKMSRNSLTEKVLSGPSESLIKHPTIVNEVYKFLGTRCLTFLLVLKMVLALCPPLVSMFDLFWQVMFARPPFVMMLK